MDINKLEAVIALKSIKEALEIFDMRHWVIIPKNDVSLWISNDAIKLHLQIIKYKNRYILEIGEIEVIETKKGLGSLVLFIVTKACEEADAIVGLWTKPENKIAIDWYKKLGFEQEKQLDHNEHIWWEKSPKNVEDDYYKTKIDLILLLRLKELIQDLIETINLENKLNALMEECFEGSK